MRDRAGHHCGVRLHRQWPGRAGMSYVKWIAAVLLLVGSFFAGHHVASLAGQVKLTQVTEANAKAAKHVAELTLAASEAARASEAKQAANFDAIAQKYEQDKANAQQASDRVIADLRSGALRLRKQWQCPPASVPGPAAGAGKPDGGADDREQGPADLVRAGRDADDQIRALQEALRSERKPASAANETHEGNNP